MITSDLHVHSIFCDGKNTPEDIVLTAIEKGLKRIGILAHSFIPFDEGVLIPTQKPQFVSEIKRLKTKYNGQIEVLCGLEQDYFSEREYCSDGFDYKIGSVHFFKKDDKLYPIDLSEKTFIESVNECFDGDYCLAFEKYFDIVSDVINNTNADIIGHFDIITKFNKDNKFFDEQSPRYVTAYKKAVDKLLKHDKPFEINTGGISRGYKIQPYPSLQIIDYIKSKSGKLILSSDSHSKETLAFGFSEFEKFI